MTICGVPFMKSATGSFSITSEICSFSVVMPFLSSFDPELVDGAVAERRCERVVHPAVLVEEGEAVEARACDGHLEVVAGAGAVLDRELVRVGKGALEERVDRLGLHRGHATPR